MKQPDEIKAAFETAIRYAILTVGMENFKKCSFFARNDPEYQKRVK